jgi:hypothetical protein
MSQVSNTYEVFAIVNLAVPSNDIFDTAKKLQIGRNTGRLAEKIMLSFS